MSIISKTTWDKFTQEEKENIRMEYESYQSLEQYEVMDKYERLFGKENLQPQLTYEDVAKALFENRRFMTVECHFTSYQQSKKLLAINKLLNVAKFLNKDWKPDFNCETPKYQIGLVEDALVIISVATNNSSYVYFRTEQLAQQAIQILGEDVIRLALTTEY